MERLVGAGGYHPESRRGVIRLFQGFDVIGPIKATLYALGAAIGIALSLNWVLSECIRITNEATISDWATSMTAKLRDPLRKLTAGETFYPSVKVVPAGRTLEEFRGMGQARTLVNIRSYPAVTLNGTEVPVIGQIAQGGEIFDVILTLGVQPLSPLYGKWGAFDCSSAPGAVWEQGKVPEPGKICAIYGDYLISSQ